MDVRHALQIPLHLISVKFKASNMLAFLPDYRLEPGQYAITDHEAVEVAPAFKASYLVLSSGENTMRVPDNE